MRIFVEIFAIFSTSSFFNHSVTVNTLTLVFLAGTLFKNLQAADEHISVVTMHLNLLPVDMIKGIKEQMGFYTCYTSGYQSKLT